MKLYFYYYGKSILGILALIAFGYMYIRNPENLNFVSENHWIGVDIFWIILFIDLLWRFIPGKFHHIGQQKYLKRNFVPSKAYAKNGKFSEMEAEHKRTMDKRAFFALGAFFLMNTVWFVLYCIGIFRPQELFGLMLLYFIGDMVCAFGICPFRIIFLRHKCCNVCRIYNWDSIMLVTPLVLVPSVYSWSLGAIAVVYTIVWEVSYRKHPERFYGTSNANLNCNTCKHGMCPYRYKKNKKNTKVS